MKPPIPDKLAFDKLTRARANLIIEQPFFGALALRLKLVEDPSIRTLAVDGQHIFYNPKFISTLEAPLVKSAVGHEVGHCVFSHITRRGHRDPKRWNQAGDYVVNEMLKDSGFKLGEKWLYDPAYAGMTADHIYSLLQQGGNGGGGDGDGLCDIRQAGGDEGETPNEVSSSPTAERDWKIATIQAAAAAKMNGKLPRSLERFVDELVGAKVDWKAVLRRFITQTAAADYSWSRPNRRLISQGLYLPRLWSESMGEMVVCVDTSGSIDGPTLNAFTAEISAIVQDTRPEKVTVIYCDAAINRVDEFGPEDDIELVPVGGGGTAFKPCAQYIEEHGIEPVCLVYLTDLYGPSNFTEPTYPWLWCCISDQVAPWGETVHMEI